MRRDKDPRERIKYSPSLFHLAHPIDGKMSGSLLVTQPYFGRGQAVLSTKEDCVMSASAAPIDCTLDNFFFHNKTTLERKECKHNTRGYFIFFLSPSNSPPLPRLLEISCEIAPHGSVSLPSILFVGVHE